MRRLFIIGLVLLFSLLSLGRAVAQAPSPAPTAAPPAPRYALYCERTRAQLGEQPLYDFLDGVESNIQAVETYLTQFSQGNLTYLEGIQLTEQVLTAYSQLPKLDCLAALDLDASTAFNAVLIGMLYGQITQVSESARYLDLAIQGFARIREESARARQAFAVPLPTSTPLPTPTLTPSPTPLDVRSTDELNAELQSRLPELGVTVLVSARVERLPDTTLVVVVGLSRFIGRDGQIFDLPNSLFTLDALSQIVNTWNELPFISRFVIETFDGSQRTLSVTATGEAFRAYYYDFTLSEADFLAGLTQETSPAP
jgi:hypothetical protein